MGESGEEEVFARLTALAHELLGEAEAAVRAHHGEGGDVAVLDAVGGLLLHLREDVADDLRRVARRLFRAGDLSVVSCQRNILQDGGAQN